MSNFESELPLDKYNLKDEDIERLKQNFTYHPPKDDQVPRYMHIREDGKSLACSIMEKCPPSRERSLALTKLEEVVMWANAAIARNEK